MFFLFNNEIDTNLKEKLISHFFQINIILNNLGVLNAGFKFLYATSFYKNNKLG